MLVKEVKGIKIADKFTVGENNRFMLIAGPCAIESEEMSLRVAKKIKAICDKLGINYVFKSSLIKQTEVRLILLEVLEWKRD